MILKLEEGGVTNSWGVNSWGPMAGGANSWVGQRLGANGWGGGATSHVTISDHIGKQI